MDNDELSVLKGSVGVYHPIVSQNVLCSMRQNDFPTSTPATAVLAAIPDHSQTSISQTVLSQVAVIGGVGKPQD